jgi:hypothetical protein
MMKLVLSSFYLLPTCQSATLQLPGFQNKRIQNLLNKLLDSRGA